MHCKEMRGLIMTDFIDHELDDAARQAVESHLSACSDCRSVFEASRTLVTQLREMPAVAAPPALWADIRRQWELRRADNRSFSFKDLFFIFHGGRVLNATVVLSLLACMSLAGMYCTGSILPASSATVAGWETRAFNDIPGEQVETAYTDLIGGKNYE